jgi:hypothetical protein
MLDPSFIRVKLDAGLDYDAYIATGTQDQRVNWKRQHERLILTNDQRSLVGAFTRRMNVLVTSGMWCGDCVAQVPMLDHIAKASPQIQLRILDRDQHLDLAEQLMICGGLRVPTVLFLNEDFEFIAIQGDKSLSRLRARAAKSLGAHCPLPGASVDQDEVTATLADWVREFEYVHLVLRLSPKLRSRHGD